MIDKLLNHFGYYKLDNGDVVYTSKSHQLVQRLPDDSSVEIFYNVWRRSKSHKTTHQACLINVEKINRTR